VSVIDSVLESIQAPRFIDFSDMINRDAEAKETWRLSMGESPSVASPSHRHHTASAVYDDDDFRLSPSCFAINFFQIADCLV